MTFWNDPKSLVPKQQHRWVISFDQKDFSFNERTLIGEQEGAQNYIPYWFAKSVDKPSYELRSIQTKYLFSHTFNFPTRPVWKPITIVFYDVVNRGGKLRYYTRPTLVNNKIVEKTDEGADNLFVHSTQVFFYKLLQDSGYFNPQEFEEPDSLVRMKKYNFKKDMIDALIGNKSPGSLSSNTDYQISNGKKIFTDTGKWNSLKIIELGTQGNKAETWKLYNPLFTDVKFDKLDYSGDNILTISVTVNYDWAELEAQKALTDEFINFSEYLRSERFADSKEKFRNRFDADPENIINIASANALPTRREGLPTGDPRERGQAVDPTIASRRLSADINSGGRVSPREFTRDAENAASDLSSLTRQGLTKTPTTSAQVLQSYFNSNPSFNEAVATRQANFEATATNSGVARRRAETALASDIQQLSDSSRNGRRAVTSAPAEPSSAVPTRGSTLPKID